MADLPSAERRIDSITVFGTVKAGAVGFAYELQDDEVEVPDAGADGPSAQVPTRQRLVMEIEWVGGTTWTALRTKGTIVIVVRLKDETQKTYTFTNMKAMSTGHGSQSIPFRKRQQFACESDTPESEIAIA